MYSFGKDAVCVLADNLGQMLCVFQRTIWDGCCVCFSVQFGTDDVCFSVQFGMDAVCVSVYNLGWMLCVFQCTIWD